MKPLIYSDFNDAIAAAYFNAARAGTPVYLDLDDERLKAAAKSLDLSTEEFHSELRRVVRDRLPILNPGQGMLSKFDTELKAWMRELRRERQDHAVSAAVRLFPNAKVAITDFFELDRTPLGVLQGVMRDQRLA